MRTARPAALICLCLLGMNALPGCAHGTTPPAPPEAAFPFENPALPMAQRARDLVDRMTLAEKVSQMQMDAPAIPRLHVPAYHWWNEALHGVARNGAATVFPQAIGMAAAWNPELHLRMAQAIAIEARAKHHEALRQDRHGMNTGLDLWAPNINIFRDPRWGRGQETYGEDPYLTSRLAVAYVKGIQGDDPQYLEAIATPKHFAVHSGPELERHRINNVISQRDLFTTYLPAFEAAVREGKAYSIMGAYNRLNGVPCCANETLLTDILRHRWGFQGCVVSDVGAINDIYQNHQFKATAEEAAASAVHAGCDLDGGTVYRNLTTAVALGLLRESEINTSVTRLMLARLRLGEFNPPGTAPYSSTPYDANDTPEHDALAREVARQSMVLLKNDNAQLPLKKNLKTVAVIGPTADSVPVLLGNYNGTPSHPVTILQGIRSALPPPANVIYEPGCPLVTELLPLEEPVPSGCLFTNDLKQTPGLKGDYFKEGGVPGRAFRTRVDAALDFDWSLQSPRDPMPVSEPFSAMWNGVLVPPTTGTYQLGIQGAGAFRIYLDGERILNDWTLGGRRSIGARVKLLANRSYTLRVEYYHGKEDAAIQLRWTRPESEPYYAAAVRAAEKSDAVIMVLGITSLLEREQDTAGYAGFYGGDRQSLDLPAVQEELLEAVAATGKPVTLVLTSGSGLAVNWAAQHVAAILQAWYPGQQGGNAVADVLFGDYSPAGRLPITFYKSVDDLPPFEDYDMAGRTYRYFTGKPLFQFGYGLSYTTFEYSDLKIAQPKASTSEDVIVTVRVKNTGTRPGDEVAQLYLTRSNREPADPLRSLAGFLRIPLQPGQTKTVQFTLTPQQLSVVNAAGERENLPGEIHVRIPPAGGLEQSRGLEANFQLQGPNQRPEYRFVPTKLIDNNP